MRRIKLLRLIALLVLSLATALALSSCGGGGNDPEPPVTLKNGAKYFPIQNNDAWSYNFGVINKTVSGDTTVNGIVCKRVQVNGETEEAWTKDADAFRVHMLIGFFWFNPPLEIPFNLEKGKARNVSSKALIVDGFESEVDSVLFGGTITFQGYLTREVVDSSMDSCIQLHYVSETKTYRNNGGIAVDTAIYDEYYAPNIGLFEVRNSYPPGSESGDMYLDLAVINGVQFPPLSRRTVISDTLPPNQSRTQ